MLEYESPTALTTRPGLQAIAVVRDTRALPYQDVERFHQTRLVRITHGRLAIWLDPFGMLNSEIFVNLSLELLVGVDFMGRCR